MHYNHKLQFTVEGIDLEDIEVQAERKIAAYVGAVRYNPSQPIRVTHVTPSIMATDGTVVMWRADIEFLVVPM